VDDLRDQLIPYTDYLKARIKAEKLEWELPHYFSTDDDERIEGIPYWDEDYCYPCATKILKEYREKGGDNEDIGIAYSWADSDVTRSCEQCGAVLEVSYTDYCIREELEHYEYHGVADLDTYPNEILRLWDLIDECSYPDCPHLPRLLKLLPIALPMVRVEELSNGED